MYRRVSRGLTAFGVGLSVFLSCTAAMADGNDNGNGNRNETTTPIKHVIILIGENRTFDNVYATYEPKRGQTVLWTMTLDISPGWYSYPTVQTSPEAAASVTNFTFPPAGDVVFVGVLQEPVPHIKPQPGSCFVYTKV